MTEAVHFVQGGEGPVLAGAGDGSLSCACGRVLIEAFQASQFLAVGMQCGSCGTITTTAPLPEGRLPLPGLSLAEVSAEPRFRPMKVPSGVAVVGRAEMDRLASLLRPNTPADTTFVVSAALLDAVEAEFLRVTGGPLPAVPSDPSDPFAGIREHALAWAVRHLRGRVNEASWTCMETGATSAAVTHVAAFLTFATTWSRHPLFPAMVATAADRGFSLHGMALFAAAHALAMGGNRTGFREPITFPARIDRFDLAIGQTDVATVRLSVFDQFEFPYGRAWDPGSVRIAVAEVIAAAQSRINLKHPGLLLLSPGLALLGFDEILIDAVKAAIASLGRKNRGLMGAGPIAMRIQPLADPHTVRFGYLLYPVANRHYSGEGAIQAAG